MISSIRAVEIGKYAEITIFKNPIQYGYKRPFEKAPRKDAKERNSHNQANPRAKHKILNLIKGNIYEHPEKPVFLTLTIAQNITDLSVANRLFTKFVMRFNYHLKKDLRYVAVPEFQERGAVHYHMLIFNLPFIKGETIEKDIWKHGATDIRLVYRQYGLFNYLTKYISKSFNDNRFKHKKRFFYSLESKERVTLNQYKACEIWKEVKQKAEVKKIILWDIKDLEGNIINTVKRAEYLTL